MTDNPSLCKRWGMMALRNKKVLSKMQYDTLVKNFLRRLLFFIDDALRQSWLTCWVRWYTSCLAWSHFSHSILNSTRAAQAEQLFWTCGRATGVSAVFDSDPSWRSSFWCSAGSLSHMTHLTEGPQQTTGSQNLRHCWSKGTSCQESQVAWTHPWLLTGASCYLSSYHSAPAPYLLACHCQAYEETVTSHNQDGLGSCSVFLKKNKP